MSRAQGMRMGVSRRGALVWAAQLVLIAAAFAWAPAWAANQPPRPTRSRARVKVFGAAAATLVVLGGVADGLALNHRANSIADRLVEQHRAQMASRSACPVGSQLSGARPTSHGHDGATTGQPASSPGHAGASTGRLTLSSGPEGPVITLPRPVPNDPHPHARETRLQVPNDETLLALVAPDGLPRWFGLRALKRFPLERFGVRKDRLWEPVAQRCDDSTRPPKATNCPAPPPACTVHVRRLTPEERTAVSAYRVAVSDDGASDHRATTPPPAARAAGLRLERVLVAGTPPTLLEQLAQMFGSAAPSRAPPAERPLPEIKHLPLWAIWRTLLR
jgi:hypothetical protein